MKSRTLQFLALAGLISLGTVGCESTQSTEPDADPVSMGVINDTCPVMGHAVGDSTEYVEYKGHKVGFCCAGCESGWEELPDEEKAKFVAEALKD